LANLASLIKKTEELKNNISEYDSDYISLLAVVADYINQPVAILNKDADIEYMNSDWVVEYGDIFSFDRFGLKNITKENRVYKKYKKVENKIKEATIIPIYDGSSYHFFVLISNGD